MDSVKEISVLDEAVHFILRAYINTILEKLNIGSTFFVLLTAREVVFHHYDSIESGFKYNFEARPVL